LLARAGGHGNEKRQSRRHAYRVSRHVYDFPGDGFVIVRDMFSVIASALSHQVVSDGLAGWRRGWIDFRIPGGLAGSETRDDPVRRGIHIDRLPVYAQLGESAVLAQKPLPHVPVAAALPCLVNIDGSIQSADVS
jgi:hypothetical protein